MYFDEDCVLLWLYSEFGHLTQTVKGSWQKIRENKRTVKLEFLTTVLFGHIY